LIVRKDWNGLEACIKIVRNVLKVVVI
jgi:hypothetical protein